METLDIGIIAHDYPSQEDWHAGAFVQARVDLYRRMGHSVDVWSRQYPRRRIPVDVLAVHYPLPEFTIPFAKSFPKSIPIVAYLHGAEAMRTPGTPFLYRIRARQAVRAFLSRDCAAVIAASAWMAQQIYNHLGVLAEIIPNPVDPELFSLIDREEASSGLCLRGAGWKYGTDLVEGLPNVDVFEPTFSRDQLPIVLGRYRFFVAPSRLEGQGLMACEAAATGMAVLSTFVGGIPEFLDPAIHTLLRDPSRQDFAREIALMSEGTEMSRAFAKSARESVLRRCGPEVTVERDIALFRNLL